MINYRSTECGNKKIIDIIKFYIWNFLHDEGKLSHINSNVHLIHFDIQCCFFTMGHSFFFISLHLPYRSYPSRLVPYKKAEIVIINGELNLGRLAFNAYHVVLSPSNEPACIFAIIARTSLSSSQKQSRLLYFWSGHCWWVLGILYHGV